MIRILFSKRALADLENIERFSMKKWGKQVAHEYLQQIDEALKLIQRHPDLLRSHEELGPSLKFYRTQKHFLVGTQIKKTIYILTVIYGSMDLPAQLSRLESSIVKEIEIFHQRLLDKKQEGMSR